MPLFVRIVRQKDRHIAENTSELNSEDVTIGEIKYQQKKYFVTIIELYG